MSLKVKISGAVLTALLSFNIQASDEIYEIKSQFIDKMDRAASIQEKMTTERRNYLISIFDKKNEGIGLSKSDSYFLNNLATRLGVDVADTNSMLIMTDKVPTSIIIAVGIKESQWGTDKVMMKANNPFGLRCFEVGCGIVDTKSDAGALHSELMKFADLNVATRYFTENLNNNTAYSDFRRIRKAMRDQGDYLTALPLVEYIKPHSLEAKNYGTEVRKIIYENKLYYMDE